ncbi:MAG: YtrH family sporulation protein [Alicyclobacillaceae bacterium]|jgi:hypothetical protein|uniref:YtrH family sporulation protein n=1 Tax=Alicyclobacillus sp. SP_1 TaxID=2942475 RepID=UPI00215761EE|nr:YtrH family sporulation protein [Alicyclobacillus sp. SP_1]MCY0887556.1 YtrH family sporulation protein [Alicyclobacillaceae bacterium]MCY0895083.1 YtrH family sporulation protein [Alicyclobacillaceae bacterium]
MSIIATWIVDFFISMGLVVGGSLFGGLATVLTHTRPPMTTMLNLAGQLKIWAMVATLGGTMDTLRVLEVSLFGLDLGPLARQATYLFAALLGCQAGFLLIKWLAGSEVF